jgi:hypothetical protein
VPYCPGAVCCGDGYDDASNNINLMVKLSRYPGNNHQHLQQLQTPNRMVFYFRSTVAGRQQFLE